VSDVELTPSTATVEAELPAPDVSVVVTVFNEAACI